MFLLSLKVLSSDKTKWRWSNLSGLAISVFINHDKVTFLSQKNISKFFPFPSPSKACVLPFNFVLWGRDPKNIFYYQHDIESYMDQVLYFLLNVRWYLVIFLWGNCCRTIGRHESYTLNFPICNLVSIFTLWVYVTFSLSFKIWLKESILIFRE